MVHVFWTTARRPVQLFAVDPINNRFLINDLGNFKWVNMDEFEPIDY